MNKELESSQGTAKHDTSRTNTSSGSTAYTFSSNPSTISSSTSTTKRKVYESHPLQTLQRRTTGASIQGGTLVRETSSKVT